MECKKTLVAVAIVVAAACQTQSGDTKPSPVTEGDDIVGRDENINLR